MLCFDGIIQKTAATHTLLEEDRTCYNLNNQKKNQNLHAKIFVGFTLFPAISRVTKSHIFCYIMSQKRARAILHIYRRKSSANYFGYKKIS